MSEERLDRIHIKELLVRCIVGINPDERVKRQDVVLNIELCADLRRACRSDAIDDTIDYKNLKRRIVAMVEESEFYLIEKLADQVARICLEDARVRQATVRIEKPGALRFARTVAVEITRRPEDYA